MLKIQKLDFKNKFQINSIKAKLIFGGLDIVYRILFPLLSIMNILIKKNTLFNTTLSHFNQNYYNVFNLSISINTILKNQALTINVCVHMKQMHCYTFLL